MTMATLATLASDAGLLTPKDGVSVLGVVGVVGMPSTICTVFFVFGDFGDFWMTKADLVLCGISTSNCQVFLLWSV